MRRFLQVTPELSVILERHRLVLALLRLEQGRALSRSADLHRDELPAAIAAVEGGPAFLNGRRSLHLEAGREGLLLRFDDPGLPGVDLLLGGPDAVRLAEALRELGRPRAEG